MKNEETKPWERQRDPNTGKLEPLQAYKYFTEYLLMGDNRSLRKLCKKLGKNSGYTRYLEEYSSKYNWQKRVQAYEEQKIQERREKDYEENSKTWYRLKDNVLPKLLDSLMGDFELMDEIQYSEVQSHLKANGESAISKSMRNKFDMILRLIDEPEKINDNVKAEINASVEEIDTSFIVQMNDKELEELLTINDDYEEFIDQL